jgi:hypothetical protein
MWLSRSAYLRTSHRTAGQGAPRARVVLLISLAAASLGGCSSVAPLPDSGLISAFASSQPRQPRPQVEIEDDGQEGQRPPPMRMFQREDDPTQPFSPNYGEVPLPQHADEGGETPPPPA